GFTFISFHGFHSVPGPPGTGCPEWNEIQPRALCRGGRPGTRLPALLWFSSVPSVPRWLVPMIKTIAFDFGNVVGVFDRRLTLDRLAPHTQLAAEAIYPLPYGGGARGAPATRRN